MTAWTTPGLAVARRDGPRRRGLRRHPVRLRPKPHRCRGPSRRGVVGVIPGRERLTASSSTAPARVLDAHSIDLSPARDRDWFDRFGIGRRRGRTERAPHPEASCAARSTDSTSAVTLRGRRRVLTASCDPHVPCSAWPPSALRSAERISFHRVDGTTDGTAHRPELVGRQRFEQAVGARGVVGTWLTGGWMSESRLTPGLALATGLSLLALETRQQLNVDLLTA